jgi:membrane-associated phospholipid phosphatase
MRLRIGLILYVAFAIALYAPSAFAVSIAAPTVGIIAGSAASLILPTVPVMLQGRSGFSLLGSEVTSDFKWLGNNVVWDAEDIVTSPLHIADPESPFRSVDFYLAVFALGGVWSGSFGLDKIMKANMHQMSGTDAGLLEHVSYGIVSAATAGLYGYGLYSGDSRAREMAITAAEGAGIATLIDAAILKPGFGRLRPRQTTSHVAFFAGGASFVSGDVTPMFGLAAGVSEYFNNAWYVAGPIYAAAFTDGFGRMGYNAHWFSDVVGAALLGTLTTELFVHLHEWHAMEGNRWHLFVETPPPTALDPDGLGLGVGLAYSW